MTKATGQKDTCVHTWNTEYTYLHPATATCQQRTFKIFWLPLDNGIATEASPAEDAWNFYVFLFALRTANASALRLINTNENKFINAVLKIVISVIWGWFKFILNLKFRFTTKGTQSYYYYFKLLAFIIILVFSLIHLKPEDMHQL